MESDTDTLCVICNSKSPAFERSSQDYFHPLNPKLLSKDLGSYFLLRHIFNLSAEQIQNYLRYCPYPGDWVKVCSDCTENYVGKCTRTFLELLEVKRSFRAAKNEVIEAVQRSMSVRNHRKTPLDPYTLNIAEEVRRFVSECNPDTEPDHSVGDEEAEKMVALLQQSRISRHEMLSSSVTVTKIDEGDRSVLPAAFVKVEYEEECEEGVNTDEKLFGGNAMEVETNRLNVKEQGGFSQEGNDGDSDIDYSAASSDTDEPEIALQKDKTRSLRLQRRETRASCNPLEIDSDPLADEEPSTAAQESKIQKCELCNRRGKADVMRKHLIRIHKRKEIITCPQCPLVFATRARMVEHMNVHRHLGLFCDICGKEETFRNLRILRKHYETEHQVDFGRLTCQICGKTMATVKGLNVHIKREHTKGKNKQARANYTRTRYKCDICADPPVDYSSNNQLNTHMVRIHGFEPSFECKTCGRRFSSLSVLTSHEKWEHLDAKDRACPAPGCGKVFKTEMQLKLHVRYAHEQKNKFVCSICGTSFAMAYQLKNHQSSIHLGIRPYECDVCGKAFVKSWNLNQHKLSHTGN